MPYIVIAALVAILELFGLLTRPISFDFLPLIVRILLPLVIIVVGMTMRGGGLAPAANVLLGVLLLMFWTLKASALDHAIATISVAVMVGVAAARSRREEGGSFGTFATAWTGLLAMLVLFVLIVGVVRTLELAEGLERQLR